MITVMVSGSEAAVERLNKALEGRGVRIYVNDHKFRGFGEKLRQVRESDLVSIISIKPVGFAGLLWVAVFAFLKLMRKPVVVRWIGTDVLELDRLHGVVYSKLVDNHIAVSWWLAEELARKRIRAKWLSMPSSLMGVLEPLPSEFAVLVYLGRDRDRFYGGEILEELAAALPHVKFMVVGRTPPKLSYANVHYYGFVPSSEMRRIYSQTTVLLRVTEHDGLGLMVLEALSRGRYVIFSHPFPYCLHEEDFAGCLKALNGLMGVTAPNLGGARYAERFDQRIWINKYTQFYEGVIARSHGMKASTNLSYLANTFSEAFRMAASGRVFGYLKWSLRYLLRGDWAIGFEMAFWEYEYKNRKLNKVWKSYDSPYPEIVLMREKFSEEVKVIELGPGPRSYLTDGYRAGSFKLVAVDPLADDYRRHLGGDDFLVQGVGEDVDKMYPPKSFHLGFAGNALDHTRDPARCLRNMAALVRVGGLVIVQGNVNEGERNSWVGIHRFNLWLDGGRLMCRARYGEPFILDAGLPLRVVDWRQVSSSTGRRGFSVTYEVV